MSCNGIFKQKSRPWRAAFPQPFNRTNVLF
nr:MAG TPA: hypothetical protein [Caudoviricetes sp.]